MKKNLSEIAQVLNALGIPTTAFLGQGSEAWVFALDDKRVARINRAGAGQAQADRRGAILRELGRTAANVPFDIPVILDTLVIADHVVTIECRLPGRPLAQVLAESTGAARDALVRAYLDAAAQIGDLVVDRPWFGDILHPHAIRTTTFRAYLAKRARRSLQAAGPDFQGINPARLAAALPEPPAAALVHLDAFPGNMLAEAGIVTAVLDFGASALMGDRRLDPLTAAVYLAPAITPAATDRDRAVAQAWLVERGLADLFPAAQAWIAAYWSFAGAEDPGLSRWCRSVLLGEA